MTNIPWPTAKILMEVADERARQDARWGQQNHEDRVQPEDVKKAEYMANEWKRANADRIAILNAMGEPSDRNCFWDGILLEEVYEALAESDPIKLREELIQVAAVAAAWVESIDRRLASEHQ